MKKFSVLCCLALLLVSAAGIHAQEGATTDAPRLELGSSAFPFTEMEIFEEVHLFTVLMSENTAMFSFNDYTGDGRLHLRAGDYNVFFLAVKNWSEYPSIADVELDSAEVSPCAVGRDNRVFPHTQGWEAIMFCDGYIDWSLTSDSFGAIMVVLRLDMDDGATATDGRALPYNGDTMQTRNAGISHSLP